MRLLLPFLLCALSLSAESVTPASSSQPPAKPTIKIGAILPLTGNNAFLGENARDAMMMRLQEFNQSGGGKFNYELILEDNALEPSKTNLAAQKLKNTDKVNIMITLWGQGSDIVLPLIKGSKILHLNLDRWTEGKNQSYDFAMGISSEAYVRMLVNAMQAMEVKRVVTLYSAEQGIMVFKNTLDRQLEKAHIINTSSFTTNGTDHDFKPWITKALSTKPDLLLSLTFMPDAEISLRQIRQAAPTLPVVLPSTACFEIAPQLRQTIWAAQPPSASNDFAAAYKKSSGHYPGYPSLHAYDALSAIIQACESLPQTQTTPSVGDISAALTQIKNFTGALGSTTFIPPNRFVSQPVYYIFPRGIPQIVSLEELIKNYKP